MCETKWNNRSISTCLKTQKKTEQNKTKNKTKQNKTKQKTKTNQKKKKNKTKQKKKNTYITEKLIPRELKNNECLEKGSIFHKSIFKER